MTKTVTEDDVILIRAGSGYLHLGIRLNRRRLDTMCCHTITDAPYVHTWTDYLADAECEKKARYLCAECVEVSSRPWAIIRRITGW